MSKRRPISHVIDERGMRLLHEIVPADWIIRELPKDYGVDLEIELVRDGVVLGQRIWAQLKTTTKAKRKKHRFTLRQSAQEPNDKSDHIVESIVFPYATEDILYANSCPFPLLLFVVDLNCEDIFWTPISRAFEYWNAELEVVLAQKKHSMYLPLWTSFQTERINDWESLNWISLDMQRSYALNRISSIYHGFLRRHRYAIELALRSQDEENLRDSLERLGNFLKFVLLQDCLFDEVAGIPFFVGTELTRSFVGQSARDQIVQTLEDIPILITCVKTSSNDYRYLLALARANSVIDLIGNIIYSYEGFMAHYVFSEVSAGVHARCSDDLDELQAIAFAQMMPLEPPSTPLPGSWGDAIRGVSRQ